MQWTPEMTAGAVTGAGGLVVYVLRRLRSKPATPPTPHPVMVQKVEEQARRFQDLAKQIQGIAYRVETMEKRLDEHQDDFEQQREAGAKSMERLIVVEQEYKFTREALADVRETSKAMRQVVEATQRTIENMSDTINIALELLKRERV